MTDPYRKRHVCLRCNSKVLEAEFVESHKALGHNVEEYVFGNPVKSFESVPEKKPSEIKKILTEPIRKAEPKFELAEEYDDGEGL